MLNLFDTLPGGTEAAADPVGCDPMVAMIHALEATASGNEKMALLAEYGGNSPMIKDALRLCCDPFILSNIKKVPETAPGAKTFTEAFPAFQALMLALHERTITGNAARDAVASFLATCRKESQEVFRRILLKDLRCGVSAKTVTKVFPLLIKEFAVQLANPYNPQKRYKNDRWYASAKLDGIRCYFEGGRLYTRNGKSLSGFSHVEEQLAAFSDRHGLIFMDGELYSHDVPFQTLTGYVMSDKNIVPEDKERIFFNAFVCGAEWQHTGEMVDFMNGADASAYEYLRMLPYEEVCNDPETLTQLADRYMSQGYEGAMLRHPSIWYSRKRDDNLLKVKLFTENDFGITGYIEGVGKYAGMLGAFTVEGNVQGTAVTAEVGSGFTDAERSEFWELREELVGKLVEVKYQNLTDPDSNGTCSLRFPVFQKLKLDR